MPARTTRLADDITSFPLADEQNLTNDASSLRSCKCLLIKQMRRYEKHDIGIQIDDSPSHCTLQLSSHSIPASSSIPVRTSTRTYNTYNVSRTAISFDTIEQLYHLTLLQFASQHATTTLLRENTV